MNSLEEYIKSHAADFNSEQPSADAEARFLERFAEDGSALRSVRTRSGARRLLRFALPAAAAAVAALLLLQPTPHAKDWLPGSGNTPEGIYLDYLAQVAGVWEKNILDDDSSSQLRSLTEETIPLIEQLPEELSDSEKAEILHEYYNTILDGVNTLIQRTK